MTEDDKIQEGARLTAEIFDELRESANALAHEFFGKLANDLDQQPDDGRAVALCGMVITQMYEMGRRCCIQVVKESPGYTGMTVPPEAIVDQMLGMHKRVYQELLSKVLDRAVTTRMQ